MVADKSHKVTSAVGRVFNIYDYHEKVVSIRKTRSLGNAVTRSLGHSVTRSLGHSVTRFSQKVGHSLSKESLSEKVSYSVLTGKLVVLESWSLILTGKLVARFSQES